MKKLTKILLVNWLYFSKQIIEVGDVNFLTGKNGAGKSTVIDALQVVLLGETSSRNFNQAANEKSQRTLDGYLRADMDDNNPYSRKGKDFTSFIACEFQDDTEGNHFVTGVAFDCRSDGTNVEHFFIYNPSKRLCRKWNCLGVFRVSKANQSAIWCLCRVLRYAKTVPRKYAGKVECT